MGTNQYILHFNCFKHCCKVVSWLSLCCNDWDNRVDDGQPRWNTTLISLRVSIIRFESSLESTSFHFSNIFWKMRVHARFHKRSIKKYDSDLAKHLLDHPRMLFLLFLIIFKKPKKKLIWKQKKYIRWITLVSKIFGVQLLDDLWLPCESLILNINTNLPEHTIYTYI